jgi:uncharacterized protein YjbJ (UPF0337 family)
VAIGRAYWVAAPVTSGLGWSRTVHLEEVIDMGGDTDRVVGKVKEAAGELTGDRELELEGRKQGVAGDVKNVGENIKRKADELGEKIKH